MQQWPYLFFQFLFKLKSQLILFQLSELEEIFIEAAEFGDFPTIKSILKEQGREQQTFSVDYTDIVGRTPLQLAVANEHLEVGTLKLMKSSNLQHIKLFQYCP